MRFIRAVLGHFLETILCGLLIVLVIVTFAQVFFRYVLHQSLSWSEETARFLLTWVAMLGAAYAFKTKAHFSLVFLVQRLHGRLRTVVVAFNGLALSAFMILFIVESLRLADDSLTQTAPGTGLSMAVPYSAAVVGGVLILYYVLRETWMVLRRPQDARLP